MYACADKLGLERAARNKFSVKLHWGINQSHSLTGKSGSTEASPAFR